MFTFVKNLCSIFLKSIAGFKISTSTPATDSSTAPAGLKGETSAAIKSLEKAEKMKIQRILSRL